MKSCRKKEEVLSDVFTTNKLTALKEGEPQKGSYTIVCQVGHEGGTQLVQVPQPLCMRHRQEPVCVFSSETPQI